MLIGDDGDGYFRLARTRLNRIATRVELPRLRLPSGVNPNVRRRRWQFRDNAGQRITHKLASWGPNRVACANKQRTKPKPSGLANLSLPLITDSGNRPSDPGCWPGV